MEDDFEQSPFTVGRMEGDKRRYYLTRPMAQQYANLGQQTWMDTVYSASVQLEPNHGFVAVLFAYHNVPDAWELGYEVRVPREEFPKPTPADWATQRPAGRVTGSTGGGSAPNGKQAPVRGATARVWAIADEVGASSRADRGKVIEACTAEGINASTAATQWSKYAKSKGW